MVRATAAILRLFEHILPHEQILVNLVRRAALAVPHLRLVGMFSYVLLLPEPFFLASCCAYLS